jgi:ABC-type glycerol-3-phosphate transport system substrate-binding protein
MSDNGFKDALDKYTQLVKNGYFSKNTMGVGMDQSIQDFIDGKGLMILHGSWWPAVVSGKNKDMEIGFFPVPPDNGTELVMASGPDKILSINAKSKNIDVSKKFLEVATSQQALSVYCKNAALPGFKDIKAEFSLVMTKVAETVASSKTALNYDNYITKSANDILNKSLSAIMAGGNPDNVIEEMDAAYQRDKEQMDTFFE